MIFQTARLAVRPFTSDDADAFYRLNSDPHVIRFIRPPMTRQQSAEFLKEKLAYYRMLPGFGSWAVSLTNSSNEIVGTFMLRPSTSDKGAFEIGFALFKDFWRKGFGEELLTAGVKHGFETLRLPSMVALIQPGNMASQSLVTKCGFSAAGSCNTGTIELNRYHRSNPMFVETERLQIIPLDYDQLRLYLSGLGKWERSMLLADNHRPVSYDVKDAVTRDILPKIQLSINDQYLFHTFWIVVDKANHTIVAELGFKGIPDSRGGIEIGYGTLPSERNNGYMSEAVGAMISWARSRPDVQYVLAETDEDNSASIRVVQKNDFVSEGRKGRMLWWRRDVSQRS